MRNVKLDATEKEIERNASKWVPAKQKTVAKINSIIDQVRKTKNVNIRISENDLANLKELSSREGLPYQTLISSVLHKYVTNQLVEERDIMHSLKLLQISN